MVDRCNDGMTFMYDMSKKKCVVLTIIRCLRTELSNYRAKVDACLNLPVLFEIIW